MVLVSTETNFKHRTESNPPRMVTWCQTRDFSPRSTGSEILDSLRFDPVPRWRTRFREDAKGRKEFLACLGTDAYSDIDRVGPVSVGRPVSRGERQRERERERERGRQGDSSLSLSREGMIRGTGTRRPSFEGSSSSFHLYSPFKWDRFIAVSKCCSFSLVIHSFVPRSFLVRRIEGNL